MSDATAKASIPGRVVLSGIGYLVQEAEDMIVFSQDRGIWGTHTRLSFVRKCQVWYAKAESSSDDGAPVSHITQAYEYVKRAYGGSFEGQNGEHRP